MPRPTPPPEPPPEPPPPPVPEPGTSPMPVVCGPGKARLSVLRRLLGRAGQDLREQGVGRRVEPRALARRRRRRGPGTRRSPSPPISPGDPPPSPEPFPASPGCRPARARPAAPRGRSEPAAAPTLRTVSEATRSSTACRTSDELPATGDRSAASRPRGDAAGLESDRPSSLRVSRGLGRIEGESQPSVGLRGGRIPCGASVAGPEWRPACRP